MFIRTLEESTSSSWCISANRTKRLSREKEDKQALQCLGVERGSGNPILDWLKYFIYLTGLIYILDSIKPS